MKPSQKMTYLARGIFFLTINDQTLHPFAIVVSLLSIELVLVAMEIGDRPWELDLELTMAAGRARTHASSAQGVCSDYASPLEQSSRPCVL